MSLMALVRLPFCLLLSSLMSSIPCLPSSFSEQVKLEALEHVSPWAEDIHQLVRSAASGQPREVLTPFTIAGYLPPVNGHNP